MLCKPSPVPGRHSDARKKPVIEAAERRTPTGTDEVEDRSPVSQEWETTFDQYGVQFLVLDRNDDTELANHFRAQPGWRVDFEDNEGVIFAQTSIPGTRDR
ncbi:MAG: hypothetical protein H8E35_09690 [Ardenticatenia bacterium]|nr:hypothetical protein [Ardenticatenia bacterium]